MNLVTAFHWCFLIISLTINKYYNPNNLLSGHYPGAKIGDIWGYETVGLIQTDDELAKMPDQSYLSGNWTKGDVLYSDLNGDGKIDIGDNTVANHGNLTIICGNNTPRYSYGINLDASWKGFDLQCFFTGCCKSRPLAGW